MIRINLTEFGSLGGQEVISAVNQVCRQHPVYEYRQAKNFSEGYGLVRLDTDLTIKILPYSYDSLPSGNQFKSRIWSYLGRTQLSYKEFLKHRTSLLLLAEVEPPRKLPGRQLSDFCTLLVNQIALNQEALVYASYSAPTWFVKTVVSPHLYAGDFEFIVSHESGSVARLEYQLSTRADEWQIQIGSYSSPSVHAYDSDNERLINAINSLKKQELIGWNELYQPGRVVRIEARPLQATTLRSVLFISDVM